MIRKIVIATMLLTTSTLFAAAQNPPTPAAQPSVAQPKKAAPKSAQSGQVGMASFYGDKFQGRRTASGEAYRHSGMTAAHRTLGFGRTVRVTSLSNGRSVVVRINDRGPFVRGRVIDLSKNAARQLGFVSRGVTRVRVQPL